MDNGFIIFKDFRIPKDNLLDKLCTISEDGTYESPIKDKNQRFANTVSALSATRILVGYSGARAGLFTSTVALRYAHLRRQFTPTMKDGEPEQVLIDYQTHQKRLIPHFANSVVAMAANEKIKNFWKANPTDVLKTEKQPAQEICHAVTSFLKAKSNDDGMKAAHESRQAMGGLGYSAYSSIGDFIKDGDVNLTLEGDNKVILMQVANFLLKNAKKILVKGKPAIQTCEYLQEYRDN